MWFAIGFAAACGLSAYGERDLWILPACVTLLVLMAVFLAIRKKRTMIQPAIAVLLGCFVGIIWFGGYHHFYLRPAEAFHEESLVLSVTASDFGYDTTYGTGLDGVTSLDGKPYQIRVYLREKVDVAPGDTLQGIFSIRITTQGERDFSTYYQGQGMFLFAYQQEEVQITGAEEIPGWCFPAVLRQRILGILEEHFPADTAPFAKALLLGDRRDLDYATTTALEISGILHIVAVSGMHISILYSVISALTLRRRFLTALVGMPVLLLFAAVAGFTPSVLRASLMVWLMMIAKVFDREYDSPTALAFAVLVMLMANPLAVTSVSLQLSVGCVAGILLFGDGINRWLRARIPGRKGHFEPIRRMVCGSISVTVSAMTLITLLSAYYFGSVSLVGVLTNLLTLWVTTAVFYGLVVICLLSLVLSGAAGLLAGFLSWPIRYVLAVAKALASLPLAAVYTKSIFIVLWLVFVYGLLASLLGMERKRPGLVLCFGTIGLCLALLASWAVPLTADTGITLLDVGQGQSILLQSEGRTFLVDCGGENEEKTADLIAETLLSQGVVRLDGIILTHFDRDHAGAIHNLLTRVDTDYLFLPDTRNDFPELKTTGKVLYVWEDLELSLGQTKLQIFGPVYSGLDNENSLCVLFDTKNCDILITGDRSAFGERMLLRRRMLPEVDLLVAGHHGAAESTSVELLTQVNPKAVLISVGRDNPYGHPSPKLLQRLENVGCTVRRTDESGTITIRR